MRHRAGGPRSAARTVVARTAVARPAVARPAVRLAALPVAVALALALVATGCSGGGGEPVDVTPTTSASPTSPSTGATASPTTGTGAAAPSPTTSAPADAASPQPSASDVSVGGVLAGFPTDVLPVPEGAQVLLTSAVPAGDQLQVSLSGRTAAPPESVLETYRASLTGAGFTESPSAGAPGALASTFTRGEGAELVSVAVVPDAQGGSATFTVGGTVAAPAP